MFWVSRYLTSGIEYSLSLGEHNLSSENSLSTTWDTTLLKTEACVLFFQAVGVQRRGGMTVMSGFSNFVTWQGC